MDRLLNVFNVTVNLLWYAFHPLNCGIHLIFNNHVLSQCFFLSQPHKCQIIAQENHSFKPKGFRHFLKKENIKKSWSKRNKRKLWKIVKMWGKLVTQKRGSILHGLFYFLFTVMFLVSGLWGASLTQSSGIFIYTYSNSNHFHTNLLIAS